MTKVVAIHAVAAAFSNSAAVVEPQNSDDPLGLEKAFDKAFAGTRAEPVDDDPFDPLGIDSAFDIKFPTGGGGGGGGGDGGDGGDSDSGASDSALDPSDPPDASESESCDTPIHDREDEITDAEEEGEEALAADDFRNSVRQMHESRWFERRGNVCYWRGRGLGRITTWNGNVSCHCKVHTSCRAPASTRWGSDGILEQWLLDAVKPRTGDVRIEKSQHQQKIMGLHQKRRLGR